MPSIHVRQTTIMLQVRVQNLDKVLVAVDHLADVDKAEALKEGLYEAGKVFRVSGANNLSSRLLNNSNKRAYGRSPGNLMKSMRIRVKRRKAGVLIGFDGRGHHAHLVDMGTRLRLYKTRNGDSGIMPANRFWRDTKSQNESVAFDKIAEGIEKAIEKIKNR